MCLGTDYPFPLGGMSESDNSPKHTAVCTLSSLQSSRRPLVEPSMTRVPSSTACQAGAMTFGLRSVCPPPGVPWLGKVAEAQVSGEPGELEAMGPGTALECQCPG